MNWYRLGEHTTNAALIFSCTANDTLSQEPEVERSSRFKGYPDPA